MYLSLIWHSVFILWTEIIKINFFFAFHILQMEQKVMMWQLQYTALQACKTVWRFCEKEKYTFAYFLIAAKAVEKRWPKNLLHYSHIHSMSDRKKIFNVILGWFWHDIRQDSKSNGCFWSHITRKVCPVPLERVSRN